MAAGRTRKPTEVENRGNQGLGLAKVENRLYGLLRSLNAIFTQAVD